MDRGLDPTLVSIATAFDAVCAGVATFAFGMLVRWVSVRILGAIGFCLLGLASVMTIYADYTSLMFVSMAVFGLGIGGMMFLSELRLGRLLRSGVRGQHQGCCSADYPNGRRNRTTVGRLCPRLDRLIRPGLVGRCLP